MPVLPAHNLVNQPDSPDHTPWQIPAPYWLDDINSLRDEGVLFGLSTTTPDGKVAEINAYFGGQAVSLQQLIEQQTDQVSDISQAIDQQTARLNELQQRTTDLRTRQPTPDNLPRTVVSLILSTCLCVGAFHLVDETLRPIFSNRWIAVGVFMAGMFNLYGRTSFFYENESRLTGRRLLGEVGLPAASSLFILVQALQRQPIGQAVALFVFVFFLFLLAGKLLLSTLTTLRSELASIQANRQLVIDQQQQIPVLETQLMQLTQSIDVLKTQHRSAVASLRQTRTELAQLNAQRDQLVNLFLSEFEFARSVRDRLTDQQRAAMFN